MGLFDRLFKRRKPTPTPTPAPAEPQPSPARVEPQQSPPSPAPFEAPPPPVHVEPPPSPAPVELPPIPDNGLATAIGDFGLALARQTPGNVVCSALSIYEAWLRVWAGARETCQAELSEALGLGPVPAVRDSLVQLVQAASTDAPDCTVSTANAIWIKPGLTIDEAFEASWGGATRELDFSDAKKAAQTINGWIEERTNGMIQNVLSERAIQPEMAIVLANAIYLKAKWQKTFVGWRTRDRPFHTAAGTTVEVPTMWDQGYYHCHQADEFELLRKPYVGDALEFVILLPRPGRFDAVTSSLSFSTLRQAINAAASIDTALQMPRTSIESEPQVDPLLRSRGATAIYSPSSADLSGLSPDARRPGQELFVSATAHKARIDVDEEGTEASAATVIAAPGGAPPGMQAPPYPFTVDRPFLYFVIERTTGAPLFSGHVVDPS